MSKRKKVIAVNCVSATEMQLDDLVIIQDDLKDLTKNGYTELRHSLIEEGICEAIGVWKDEDDRPCVVSGTQRVLTLRRMRDQEGHEVPLLPVTLISAQDLHEALRKALRLAGTAGTPTSEGLYKMLHRLGGNPEEMLKGFTHPEIEKPAFIDAFFKDQQVIEVHAHTREPRNADDVPEAEAEDKLWVRRGNIFQLGRHRLMCGDSTSADDVSALMAGEKAALWSSDPPYGINHVATSQEKGQSDGYADIANDDLQDEALREFLLAVINVSLPHMEKGFAFYMWHAMKMQAYFSQAAAAGILFHRQIIWVKPQFVFGRGHYHWRHELCLMGWLVGDEPPFLGERNQSTVWEVARENDKIHPTQKPVELFSRPIRNHLRPGQIVYEPFAGSGSNIIAAEDTGAQCRAMELEPRYCQVIIRRFEDYTGQKAVLLNGEKKKPKTVLKKKKRGSK